MGVRVRDEHDQVTIKVRRLRGQFAVSRELAFVVGRIGDIGLEGVTRTLDRIDFSLGNNFEVEGQGSRSVEAVGDCCDGLCGLTVVRRRDVARRDGRGHGQPDSLFFGRQLGDVDDGDLGSGTGLELSQLDLEDVWGRFLEQNCSSMILSKGKVKKIDILFFSGLLKISKSSESKIKLHKNKTEYHTGQIIKFVF